MNGVENVKLFLQREINNLIGYVKRGTTEFNGEEMEPDKAERLIIKEIWTYQCILHMLDEKNGLPDRSLIKELEQIVEQRAGGF